MKKTSVRMFATALLAAAACFATPAFGGEIEQGPTGIKVGATLADYANNYYAYVRSGIEFHAANRVNLTMTDSRNNQTVQNEVVDTLITKGSQVLAVGMVDAQSASTIIEKARAYDLPLILFGNMPSAEVLHSYDKCWYVGIDGSDLGRLQGEMVVKEWKENMVKFDRNGDGILQYVLIMGTPGHSEVALRTDAFEKVIAESGIKAVQLAKQQAEWNTTKAKELMEAWIGRFGNQIEMVVSNNDAMAIGAVEALRANGLITKDVLTPVVGVNALPEASALIRDGIMFGSILTDPTAQGQAIVELSINAGKGRFDDITYGTQWQLRPDKSIRIPGVMVTEENVDKAMEVYKK